MNLTEFLLARIAEREAAARDDDYEWMTRHHATMKPEVLLAECEAKRRIVAVHSPAHVTTSNDGLNWDYRVCTACLEPDDAAPGDGYWPCLTMAFLALPYADHPDYDEEWRP